MKIYQLHKCIEGAGDFIIRSFLRKERADEVKAEKEVEYSHLLEASHHCERCPYCEDIDDLTELAHKMTQYCDHSDTHSDDVGDLFCKAFQWYPNAWFQIKQINVEE